MFGIQVLVCLLLTWQALAKDVASLASPKGFRCTTSGTTTPKICGDAKFRSLCIALRAGKSPSSCKTAPGAPPCIITLEFAPVCCGGKYEYSNQSSAACDGFTGCKPGKCTDKGRQDKGITGKLWYLTQFFGAGRDFGVDPGNFSFPTIKLTPEAGSSTKGSYGGNTGCNSYGGTYTVLKKGSIKFGPAISTLRACLGPIVPPEGEFLKGIQQAKTWQLQNGGTQLVLLSGTYKLVFGLKKPSKPPPPPLARCINNGPIAKCDGNICNRAKCPGNPNAKCQIIGCTRVMVFGKLVNTKLCQPLFLDVANKKVANCKKPGPKPPMRPILKCKGKKAFCFVDSCQRANCPKNPKAICEMATCSQPILAPTGKVLKKVNPCDPVFYDQVTKKVVKKCGKGGPNKG